jgi:hypothetical protein
MQKAELAAPKNQGMRFKISSKLQTGSEFPASIAGKWQRLQTQTLQKLGCNIARTCNLYGALAKNPRKRLGTAPAKCIPKRQFISREAEKMNRREQIRKGENMDAKTQHRGQDDRTDKPRDQRQQSQNSGNRMEENLNPQGDKNADPGSSNFDKQRDVTAQPNRSSQPNQPREAGSAGVDEERENMEAQTNRSGQNSPGRGNQQRDDQQQPRSRRLNEQDEDDASEPASKRADAGNREPKGDQKAKLNQ